MLHASYFHMYKEEFKVNRRRVIKYLHKPVKFRYLKVYIIINRLVRTDRKIPCFRYTFEYNEKHLLSQTNKRQCKKLMYVCFQVLIHPQGVYPFVEDFSIHVSPGFATSISVRYKKVRNTKTKQEY